MIPHSPEVDAAVSLIRHPVFAQHRAFLLWRLEPHPTDPSKGLVKVPYHYDGRTRHNIKHGNPAAPLSAEEAGAWVAHHRAAGLGHDRKGEAGFIGVGFRPSPDNRLVCLDLDDCIGSDNTFDNNARQWASFYQGAALELSHGGRGLHIWFTHQGDGPGRRGKRVTPVGAVEMYGEGQFIALGTYLGGDPSTDCTAQMQATLMAYFPTPTRRSGAVTAPDWDGKTPEQQAVEVANLRSALQLLDPDDRDTWVAQGQALACLGDVGRQLWDEWSATSERFPGGSDLEKFDTFTGDRSDYRAVFSKAQSLGWYNPGAVVPASEWTTGPAEGWRDGLSEERITDRLNGKTPAPTSAAEAFGLKHKLHELWAPSVNDLADAALVPKMRAGLLSKLMTMYGGNCAAVAARMANHPLLTADTDLQAEVLRACGGFQAWWAPKLAQRQLDAAETKALGETLDEPILPVLITPDQAAKELTYIERGQYVAIRNGRKVYKWADACGVFEASTHEFTDEEGKVKRAPVLVTWRKSRKRLSVGVATWRPSEAEFCAPVQIIDGLRVAYNTWRGFQVPAVPPNWAEWASLFEQHVAYLVPIEAERKRFLQWLAHIIQRPGELPHTAYLMITEQTGTGRNWLASALARVVRGYVAMGVPLNNILDGKFNGVLSQKLLVTVDEVQAGVEGDRYGRSNALKQIITEEHRQIDHKYGMQLTEQNCARWLIFSNHDEALPMDNTDRRFITIANPTERMPEDYYATLYSVLKRPEFVASVYQFLATLSLEGFNAGMPAQMNAAKSKAIESMVSAMDRAVVRFVAEWPTAYATDRDLRAYLQSELGETPRSGALAHAKRRAGIVMFGKDRPRIGMIRESILLVRPDGQPVTPDTVIQAVEAGRKAMT